MAYVATVLFITGGGFFVLASLGMFLIQHSFDKTRTPVKLVVVDSHARTGENGITYIHPEYEIVSGPRSGLKMVSDAGSFPPFHNKGDHVDGYFDSRTGEIQSRKEVRLNGWLILGIASLGCAMLALGGLSLSRII